MNNTPLQMGHAASYPNHRCPGFGETLEIHLSNVRSFTTTFGQPAPEKPTVPSSELAELRHKLLKEESEEILCAETLTLCLDAVCDQLYVALGNAVACGFTAAQINRGLAEVHRSNMTKLWREDELDRMPEGSNRKSAFAQVGELDSGKPVYGGRWIVRSAQGKILKPPGYSPADLSWIEEEDEK